MTQFMGMAPGAHMLYMYVCGDVLASGSGDISDTACISAMVTDTDAPLSMQISCSWGWTPADPSTLDPYFEQMASQGQNFFAASGDSSAWSASNEAWPADDANIVSVGGDRPDNLQRSRSMEIRNRLGRQWWRHLPG